MKGKSTLKSGKKGGFLARQKRPFEKSNIYIELTQNRKSSL
jgi:hypothetical protein